MNQIFLAQINPVIGDLDGNRKKIISALIQAKKEVVKTVLFPELAISGYPPGDLLLHDEFLEACADSIKKILPYTKGLNVVCGTPRQYKGKIFNSAAVLVDGELIGYHDKVSLPTYDVFDEHRYFTSGKMIKAWGLEGESVGITICEDIWSDPSQYDRDPVKELQEMGVSLVLNLSASPFSVDKHSIRESVCSDAAKRFGCPVVMCNQVGANDSLVFDGHSLVVGEDGSVIGELPKFQEVSQTVDLKKKHLLKVESTAVSRLYNALVLGIRDYFHKQNFTKACLGVSGGIDSAVVAALAVEALGKNNVLSISMPSRYSSFGSEEDAKQLADNLGIEFWRLPIEEPFKAYLNVLKNPFFETEPNVAEENLQARIRGMLLMAVSNKFGHLVLATGNKSEMAMGYSTLYGDSVGGLAVLSDVTKRRVYALADYINQEKELIPRATISKPPSAELRPDQKDSDSLPPYDTIDTVLELYVEKLLSPEEILEKTKIEPTVITRVIKAIHQNEYKRRQIPLGLRVTEKAFSAGRRFPIVQRWK